MFLRLPGAPALVQADSTSENILNETCQILCYLHQAKEITLQSI